MKQLHILNGDSTLSAFQTQSIPGEVMVWREVLAEGKSVVEIGNEAFWKMRKAFFHSFFNTPDTKYQERVIQEFEKLKALKQYDEVILWFEYDLFCQINMMAILSWLAEQNLDQLKIALICLGKHPNYDRLVGLGEIDPKYYPTLFQNRYTLDKEDLQFAQKFWVTYCTDAPGKLLTLTANQTKQFPYLHKAVEAHLTRFPSTRNGLNQIEQQIVDLFHSGVQEDRQIVGQLLRRENLYGFGDLQYFVYLKNLKSILNKNTAIKDFETTAQHEYYYGGSKNWDYRWDGMKLLAV